MNREAIDASLPHTLHLNVLFAVVNALLLHLGHMTPLYIPTTFDAHPMSVMTRYILLCEEEAAASRAFKQLCSSCVLIYWGVDSVYHLVSHVGEPFFTVVFGYAFGYHQTITSLFLLASALRGFSICLLSVSWNPHFGQENRVTFLPFLYTVDISILVPQKGQNIKIASYLTLDIIHLYLYVHVLQ